MKTRSLAWLLLLLSTAARAEEIFPEQRVSDAELKKGWQLSWRADAHFALGEYPEAIEAAKSAFRILRDVRILTQVALLYEHWGSQVSDPKESYRLHKQAVFFYERLQLVLLPGQRGVVAHWARRTLAQRLPPLKEALEEADEDAVTSPSERTMAELEAELARTRAELAKERAELAKERTTRTALEQAIRTLAAQKPLCPVSEAPPIPVSAPYATARLGQ
jgi:tetratricopeptide (TPR) repeat protein